MINKYFFKINLVLKIFHIYHQVYFLNEKYKVRNFIKQLIYEVLNY